MNKLLSDEIFTVRRNGGDEVRASLSELYVRLVADDVESLPAMRPHQWQAVHCFLVQVGALALLAGGMTEPPRDVERWRALLRGLTPDFSGDEPWSLVVDDLSKPAFMQAPLPGADLAVLREREESPDALDMLVTSKAHDLKSGTLANADVEHWIYALITLQTLEGFLGRGNYGISRMNGGFASRPFIGARPTNVGWGGHVMRDIRILVQQRGDVLDRYPAFAKAGGLGLVWLAPWNGEQSLTPQQLDPYYVEICRRIRMTRDRSVLIARRGSSKCARIKFPDALSGVTGDPWTPVSKGSSPKPLTVDASGFHYRRVVDLIGGDKYEFSFLQGLDETEARSGAELVFVVTVRGQGETQGFHERRVRIPPKVVPYFMRSAASPRIATLGRARVQDVSTLSSKALRPALFALLQGAPEEIDFKDPKADTKAKAFITRFEQRVDETFFDHLFDELAAAQDADAAKAARKAWLEELVTHALEILSIAESGSPLSHIRRYRARAAAESVLRGAIRNQFPDHFGAAP